MPPLPLPRRRNPCWALGGMAGAALPLGGLAGREPPLLFLLFLSLPPGGCVLSQRGLGLGWEVIKQEVGALVPWQRCPLGGFT